MKNKSQKSRGRPPKQRPLSRAMTLKFTVSAFQRLKKAADCEHIPVATLVRKKVLDWLDGVKH